MGFHWHTFSQVKLYSSGESTKVPVLVIFCQHTKSCNLFLVSLEDGSTGRPGFPGNPFFLVVFVLPFWSKKTTFVKRYQSEDFFRRVSSQTFETSPFTLFFCDLCNPNNRDYLSLQVYSISCLCGSLWWLFTRSGLRLEDQPPFCCSFYLFFRRRDPLQLIENRPVEV